LIIILKQQGHNSDYVKVTAQALAIPTKYLSKEAITGPIRLTIKQMLLCGPGKGTEAMSKIIDTEYKQDILTVEETAEYLRKSTSWVYKNWKMLGGRKLGGSLIFPSKEDLYEYLFSKNKGVEVRLYPEGDQAHRSLVQDKKRRKKVRSRKKEGGVGKYRIAGHGSSDRHDLFGSNK